MAVQDWLEENINERIRYTGNGKEARFNCPYCGDTRGRFYVNLYTGECYCHNCSRVTNMTGLISYISGVSIANAKVIFKESFGNTQMPTNIARATERALEPDYTKSIVKRAIPLPEEYIKLDLNTINPTKKRAIKYLHNRGITNKQILEHSMGFCSDGEYANRVIIPITRENKLQFWVGRAISSNTKLKEKSPSNADYQISKSQVIFNIDKASKKYHTCVLSEGIFDALSWGDIGCSLLGKKLYDTQIDIILEYRNQLTDGLYIAIDEDAYTDATEIAKKLSQYLNVYIINIPKEFGDPNEMLQKVGRKELLSLIPKAEKYSEYTNLSNAVNRILHKL